MRGILKWIGIGIAGLIGLIIVIAVVGGGVDSGGTGEGGDASPPVTVTQQETEQQDEEAAEEEPADTEEPEPSPPPAPPPQPRRLSGSGSAVENVRLRQDAPLVVAATHSGSANFIVELVPRGGGGSQLLINQIGSYSGEVAYADAASGRYRVAVDADGSWQLNLSQPQPGSNATSVPGRLSGEGAEVIPIRAEEDFQAVVSARHRGQANFIVEFIGHGDLTGSQLVFNEIGNFQGETLIEVPAGGLLVAVEADGSWTLRIRR